MEISDGVVSSELTRYLNRIMESSSEDDSNRPLENKKIHRVPEKLRQIESNKSCFDPLVVSIGPCHHGEEKLKPMEEFKISLTRMYVNSTESKSIHLLYKEVEKLARDARECYTEDLSQHFDDEAFTKMMMIDGCFVLQFIECFVNNELFKLKITNREMDLVYRDLFLLENQLPFKVLQELMKMRYANKNKGLEMIINFVRNRLVTLPPVIHSCFFPLMDFDIISYAIRYFIRRMWSTVRRSRKKTCINPVHLLELVWRDLIDVNALEPKGKISTMSYFYSFHSAKDLNRVGISFRPINTRRFTDVTFESHHFKGIIRLPQMVVNDSTKSLLLNLIALEYCPNSTPRVVTSYIWFIKSLINDPDDVQVMCSGGVLVNLLGSNIAVANLLTEVTTDLVPDIDIYADVKNTIRGYFGRAEVRNFDRFSLSAISFFLTIYALVFTIIQTICSIMQTYFTIFPPLRRVP